MPTRGRPPKFGRPAKAIILTLPDNVLEWLRTLHTDPAWAIVLLHERFGSRSTGRDTTASSQPELVQLSGKRALIVVNPMILRRLEGVSIVPLADGRALIALDPGKGVADLELAILDRMERLPGESEERAELVRLRQAMRRWRSAEGLRFQMRSIIIVEQPTGRSVRPSLALGGPLQRKRKRLGNGR